MLVPSLLIPGIFAIVVQSVFEPAYPAINGDSCLLPKHTFPRSWVGAMLVGSWRGSKIQKDGTLYNWQNDYLDGGRFKLTVIGDDHEEIGEWHTAGMILSLTTREIKYKNSNEFQESHFFENYILQSIDSKKMIYCNPESGEVFEALKIESDQLK